MAQATSYLPHIRIRQPLRRAWRRLDLDKRVALMTAALSTVVVLATAGVFGALTYHRILQLERQEAAYQTDALAGMLQEQVDNIETLTAALARIYAGESDAGDSEGDYSPAEFIDRIVGNIRKTQFSVPGLRNVRLISVSPATGFAIGHEILAVSNRESQVRRMSAPLLDTSYDMAFVIDAARRDSGQVTFNRLRILTDGGQRAGRAAAIVPAATVVAGPAGDKLALLMVEIDMTDFLSRLGNHLSRTERFAVWPLHDDLPLIGLMDFKDRPPEIATSQTFTAGTGQKGGAIRYEREVTAHGRPLLRLSYARQRSALDNQTMLLTLGAVGVILFAIMLSVALARYITRPISRLIGHIRDFANGRRDLEDLVQLARSAEETVLVRALEVMRRRFDERGITIRRMADRLNMADAVARIGLWESSGGAMGGEFWNDALCRAVLGHSADARSADNCFLPLRSFVHPDDVGAFDKLVADRTRGNQNFSLTLRLQMADGGYMGHQMIGQRASGDGNAPLLAALVNVEELRRADRMKADVMTSAGQEPRTPVNGAIGLLMSMYSARITEQEKQVLDSAGQGAGVAGRRTVDDLLDLSRADAGNLALRLERVDLAECVARALDECRAGLRGRNIPLRLLGCGGASPVLADPARLNQIMRNLLSNALRVAPEGTGVHVGVEDRGKTFRVTVRDFGPGVPTHLRNTLFRRFVPPDPLDRDQGGRVGLGLVIALELVRAHRGAIGYEPANPGSIFYFELLREDAGQDAVARMRTAVGQ